MGEESKEERKKRLIEVVLENEQKIASRFTAIQVKDRSFLKVLQLGYILTGKPKEADRVGKRIEER